MEIFDHSKVRNLHSSNMIMEIIESLMDFDEQEVLEVFSEIISERDLIEEFLEQYDSQEILQIIVDRHHVDDVICESTRDILETLVNSVGYNEISHMLKDIRNHGDVFTVK